MASINKSFCKAIHLHGFYELSKSHSKVGRVIWFIAIVASLSITTYLVIDAANEFVSESVRIVLKQANPEDIYYPAMKFCFVHWLSWVDWDKVEEHNFTRYELLYAMSYLVDINSTEFFDVEQVETSVKEKLYSQNMTLKEFYLSIVKRKDILYEMNYANDYTVELVAINNPNIQNIFYTRHTICYVVSEETVKKIIYELKQNSSNHSSERYALKIAINSLTSCDYGIPKYLTKMEVETRSKYTHTNWNTNPEAILFFPDINSPTSIYLIANYSYFALEMKLSLYSKVSSTTNGRECIEGKKSAAINFTVLEDYLSETRARIFRENKAEEDWIGYVNDVRPKTISFLDENGQIIENLTYHRHHKLESWYQSSEKVEEAHHRMLKLKDVDSSNEYEKIGCQVWDVVFGSHFANEKANFISFSYPKTSEIVVREEKVVSTWLTFISNIGGVLGIWIGASIVTLIQIFHLLFGCARVKKRPLPNHND